MWSPFINCPLTFFIPVAKRLLPFFSACTAPSSIIKSPLGEIELIIHFFLACNFETFGKNQVPLFVLSIFKIGLFIKPFAITILHPEFWQILAASILVVIPPVPCSPILLVAIFSMFVSMLLILLINFAFLLIFGFEEYSPSTSESKIKQSAPNI